MTIPRLVLLSAVFKLLSEGVAVYLVFYVKYSSSNLCKMSLGGLFLNYLAIETFYYATGMVQKAESEVRRVIHAYLNMA